MKPKKSGSVDLVNLAKTSSQLSLSLPKFLPTPIRLKEKLALLPAYWDGVYTVFRLVFPFTKLVPTVSLAPISLSLSCALKVTREPISISPHSFDHRKSRKKVFFFLLFTYGTESKLPFTTSCFTAVSSN